MLVLSRRREQVIAIGEDVLVTVLDIRGDKVRLGIEAPIHIPVHRKEIADAIAMERSVKPEDVAVFDEQKRTVRLGKKRS